MKFDVAFFRGEILNSYFSDVSSVSIVPFGTGHINDTFLIETAGAEKFLLQRINHEVFKDVAGLMNNMELVTRHIQEKLQESKNDNFTSLEIIPTQNNGLFTRDQVGHYWRLISFVSNSVTYDLVTSEKQAYQAGYAFGYFQRLLSDLPGNKLQETIPDFHAMDKRFVKFDEVVKADVQGRLKLVEREVEYAYSRRDDMLSWQTFVNQDAFPQRVTHNDTKFNNVLLDKNNQQAICVIDLDTVMPGVIGYDFGDALRTIANEALEDEEDLGKVIVNLDYYRAFSQGFLGEASHQLTEAEKTSLAFAPNYMTFIMGLRFLTDYLEGDAYYKIDYPDQNRRRAKAQFKLESEFRKNELQTKGILSERLT